MLSQMNPNLLYDAACASSRLGNRSEAMGYVERLAALGGGHLAKAETDEDLRYIREHPLSSSRFRAILELDVHSSD